jgi:23S rRNA pseudouridine2605 synthase
MRQDQLEQARRTRWRQDGNALVTLDDAERWLAETPLCLYLPRRQHLPVPAPSFVEAIAGRADATPGPEHVADAAQMLARLVASGAVIALNLFGAAPGIGVSSFVGEHPDFLATPEALPYLYAMQPERNPKRPPTTVGGARVSPLAAEAYTLLEREGALTTIELRSRLGREVTEAAVLRSLAELWHTMRVVPVPADNPQEGAHWELLSARHRRELNIGSTQSQTTALSILVSFYLQSAIAATAEEVEIFLSPLAPRSRIRDVVHGLSTTRQLASFSLAGDEQFYVEGTLPEIAEEEAVALAAGAIAGEDAGLEQNEPDLTEAAAANPPEFSRAGPPVPRRSPRPAFGERARGSFAARDRRPPSTDRPPRREGGFRRPERSGPRGPARGDSRGSFRRVEGVEGTDRPPRPNFERRARPSFANTESRERPTRSGGPSRPRTFDRPERGGAPRGSFDKSRPPRPAGGSFRPEKSFAGKPFRDRPPRAGEGTERPRFRPSAGARTSPSGSPRFEQGRPGRPPRDGERPPRSFGRPEAGGARPDRPFRKSQGDRPDRAASGPGRFERRPGGSGRPTRPGSFSRPPRRDGESRPPFREGQSRPQGDRPFKRPYSSAGDRPPGRGPARSFGKSASGDRPQRDFTPRPRPEGGGPATRPEGGDRESRPIRPAGQRPGRPGGFSKPAGRSGSFRKPAFGKPGTGRPSFSKPGGYRKPEGDQPAAGEDSGRPPRSSFASGPRKAGGFRKPGAPGKSFGKPRPPGAPSGRPRPGGAGKGRTSTTTSSGMQRPGAGGKPRTGKPGSRPPAKGGFKSGGFKSGGKRAPGFGAPKRKPRGEGDES